LDELVARARTESGTAESGSESRRRRIGPRFPRVGLAWAASIAIAVGAGLLARELALQRGRDLPAELDFGRDMVAESAEEPEGLREDVPVAADSPAGALPARQKSEVKATDEEDVSETGRGAEARRLDVSARLDAELAEAEAPPAAPPAEEAVGRLEEQQPGDRARFAAPPPAIEVGKGHPALGCWRLARDQEGSDVPAELRLTDERLQGDRAGAMLLEAGPEPAAAGGEAGEWSPLGADSVWLSIPPRILRLAQADDELVGHAMTQGEATAEGPAGIRFTRVECGTP
jgi:hypothetical protein